METSGNIHFGEFVLNRARGCLEDGAGSERFLRPKSFRVLEALAERRGQLVSKDDLVTEVWPDVIVSDDSLAHCVSDIRRALGPEGAVLLRTVPRRGYMLTAEAPGPEMVLQPDRRRIGLSAIGLAAATLVVSLGITVKPLHEINTVVRTELQPELAQADALLKARDWQRREDNETARALIEAVLVENADHARAWSSLGLTYWLEVRHLAWGGGRREMERALDMVELAIVLGGDASAHRLLAEMRLLAPFSDLRSPIDALASARAAVAMSPEDPDNLAVLSHALALTGRADEAVASIEEARRLNQDAPDWYEEIAGLGYLLAGEPDRAVEAFGPLHGSGTYASVRWWPGWLLASSLAHAGRIDDATRIVDSALQRQPQANIVGVAQSFDGLQESADLVVVLDGLRLAGLSD